MRIPSLLVAALAIALGAGCSSTSGSTDGGSGGNGSGGSSGTGGNAATGGSSGGTGGQGGAGDSIGTGGSVGTGGGSGGQGGQGGQALMTCSPACGSGSICVATGTEGGVQIFANDAGVCPTGRHLSGQTCINDLAYACMTVPAGCAGTVTCACASSLCPALHSCQGPSAGILSCIELVP
jgi:hypothetical protein